MLKDLKAFLFRGNIVDLAVAVVIGGAFGAIIKSFVNDIIFEPSFESGKCTEYC